MTEGKEANAQRSETRKISGCDTAADPDATLAFACTLFDRAAATSVADGRMKLRYVDRTKSAIE
jgi:hypothetical protein